jgi:ABC-type sugar transport system substrate-binding protein
MKKLLLVLFTTVLMFTFLGCGNKETVDIGYSVPDTTNPFLGWLTSAVKEQAEADGLTIQIADAGNSSVTQIEQIENFIAMKVKVLAIMPIDPNNVQAVIQKAQAAGIKVLVAGTDTTYYDVMMNMDQYNAGEQIAEMFYTWKVETFGEEAQVKVIVMKCTETVDMTNRSNGIVDKINSYDNIEVVIATAEARSTAAATAVMENMWQQNSDAVGVLTYNADGALGVNEYIMGLSNVNKAEFGIFSGDWSPPIQEVLNNSLTNLSVFRGTMQIVGPQINGVQTPLEQATYSILKALSEDNYTGATFVEDAIAKAYGVTAEE